MRWKEEPESGLGMVRRFRRAIGGSAEPYIEPIHSAESLLATNQLIVFGLRGN